MSEQTARVLAASDAFRSRAEAALDAKIPEFPVGMSDAASAVAALQTYSAELQETGQLLVDAKMIQYYLDREKRSVDSAMSGAGNRGNAALASQSDVLKQASLAVGDLKYVALERLGVLRDLVDVMKSVKSSFVGG